MLTAIIVLLSWCLLGGRWSEALEFHEFVTEPSFRSPYIYLIYDQDHYDLQPGYFFLAPFNPLNKEGDPSSFGPHIYDNEGQLVWNGNHTASNRGMHLRVCDTPDGIGNHLCFHDSYPDFFAYAVGTIRILNSSYMQTTGDYIGAGELRDPDLHELNMPTVDNGTTMLQAVYEVASVDLRPYNGSEDGYALNGCFQEIDLKTRGVNFQWCALDHVELWETQVYPHTSSNYSTPNAGAGTLKLPWDFFHINAIDKNAEGDYIISARHLDTILKIAGNNNSEGVPPGEILWRFGGKKSNFHRYGFTFSRQHMVRFVSSTENTTTISYFDNAYDGFTATSDSSAGHIVVLDHVRKSATLIRSYPSPVGELSLSQGSMQTLPNGNVLIGWGNRPFYSEWSGDGTLLYHACFTDDMEMESFRVYKHEWVGQPLTKPKVVSYAQACSPDARTIVYVSWNGATEVKSWRAYASRHTSSGPWGEPITVTRTGFETMMELPQGYVRWVYVEALDIDGNVLQASNSTQTFVPQLEIEDLCDEYGCNHTHYFEYDLDKWSRGQQCVPWSDIAFGSSGSLLGWLVAAEVVFLFVGWFVRSVTHFAMKLENV